MRQRLAKISQRNGGTLSPDAAVADALKDQSFWKPLLPKHFYDDKLCAHEHRKDIMRRVISVRYVNEETVESVEIKVPDWLRDQRLPKGEQGYMSIAVAKSDREIALEQMRYEIGRAVSIMERALDISVALGMETEVKKQLKRLNTLYSRLEAAA
jgi:hypothetical protein